jgi:uncharacterized alpha-E superfamily protein
MLSRVADRLYWMSRYLERAEHTARVINVNLNLMLDESPEVAARRWDRLRLSLQAPPLAADSNDAHQITELMTFDQDNRSSIFSCIAMARDNLRHVREQISSEMWEQLNRLFHQIRANRIADLWNVGPHEFFRSVTEGMHLFQGITDSTMTHGEGWQFIQVGRYIERICATAVLLDVHFKDFFDSRTGSVEAASYLDWVGLLKSCTAFEAYCKAYTAELAPERIAEFLLLNSEFPRSVRFAAETMQNAFEAIAATAVTRKPVRLNRLAGRLRASLDFGQIDEIMDGGLPAYLSNIQSQAVQIHNAIQQTYIAYPIESALAS